MWFNFYIEIALKKYFYIISMQIVFLGDSITEWWDPELFQSFKKYNAINCGVSGHSTRDTLNFLKDDYFWSIKPECVILQIGTNNADKGFTTIHTFNDIQEIIRIIQKRLPNTVILLIGPLPRGETKTNRYRVINKEINKLLDTVKFSDNVYYLDIGYLFLEHDDTISKTIMNDYLHLTKQGYIILSEHLSTLLFIMFGTISE
jgi:lysophospholipase L1-like esterase